MKKIIFILVLVLTATFSQAQSNPNEWGVDSNEPQKDEFSFVPLVLSKLEREVKLTPDYYSAGFNMLAVSNEDVDYQVHKRDKSILISMSTIKPTDVFVKLKNSRELTLIKNVKSNQLYIIEEKYINYQSDMFKPESLVIKYKKAPTALIALSPQEIALIGRYKKVLTNGSTCTQTITTISNKKQYAFRDGFDPRKVTAIDKKAYNGAIKKLWSLNSEWKTIREDETLLNKDNKLMEKLMDVEKYRNIKIRMEYLYSTPLL